MNRYQPCHYGLHVCGIDEAEDMFVTVANIPAATGDQARRMFEAARSEFACAGDEQGDLVVDLCLGPNEMPEDFRMTRQLLQRLIAKFRW